MGKSLVGLVVVSHSRPLASALVDLVAQVASQEVPIAIAAGVGHQRQEFGTDAAEIVDAIQSVYSPTGVLVLMDLGSAILSAEMALDLLPAEMRPNIRFCAAPLVEGAIAAGVQASLGSDLDAVCAEAQAALRPKLEQIGVAGETTPPGMAQISTLEQSPAHQVVLRIQNVHGLHARPAACFVRAAAQFDALIQVSNRSTGKGPVSASSLNALATLGVLKDHEITVTASGPQAEQALAALTQLVQEELVQLEASLADVAPQEVPVTPVGDGALQAIPLSEGIALGPLHHIEVQPPFVPDHAIDDPSPAFQRLSAAIEQVKRDILARRRDVSARLGAQQGDIFDAHFLILEDPELLADARHLIFAQHKNEAAAWQEAIQAIVARYQALEDPYLQQRAADVADVGNQVLSTLSGDTPSQVAFSQPVVLVAEDLTPTQTAQLDLDHVLGIVTLVGGPNSHTAILARSLGIPAVAGVPPSVLRLPNNTPIALDGFRGALWVTPPQETQQQLLADRATWVAQRQALLQASSQPAMTKDGHPVEVVANVGSLRDAQLALKNGAEGIGLLRTEFLFITRSTPPDEAEQHQALKQIATLMGDRPVIVRTLDVGGDKSLPYIDLPPEANPFLGVRAIRLSLRRPDLFTPQLRAILRAGSGHKLRLMFPMVVNLDEVLQAKAALQAAHNALENEDIPHAWPMDTGIMVETPSAALLAPLLAPHVDFFSIGTNDLTQYTLAAERGNPDLSQMADALHPAVLRLIQQVVAAADQHGKWVGVCGELAGDPLAAPALLGLGVKELSLNSAAIPRLKATLRRISLPEAQDLAQRLLLADSAPAARRLAKDFAAQLA